jgi:hypothetical protein
VEIGDLVKYDKALSGLEKCMGVIVAVDGTAFVVQWFDRHSMFVPGSETSVELADFLEVISGNR